MIKKLLAMVLLVGSCLAFSCGAYAASHGQNNNHSNGYFGNNNYNNFNQHGNQGSNGNGSNGNHYGWDNSGNHNGFGSGNGNRNRGTGDVQAPEPVSALLFLLGGGFLTVLKSVKRQK